MKKTLRKYWSKAMSEHIVQVKGVRFDNPQFSFETDFTKTDFTDKLVSVFKLERQTVDAFYNELAGMSFYDSNPMTNRELFDKYFPGRNDVVRLLMEPITYANGSTLDEPAITYGIVFSNFMSQGVYTFSGGTDLMLDMMANELKTNHATVALRAKLDKIVITNGKVTGAVINGKLIRCRAVLSNGNLISTVNQYIGTANFSSEFITKVNQVRLNTSSCQVYIGFKPGEKLDFIGDLLFTSSCAEFAPEKLISQDTTSRTYSVYYPEIRPGSNDYTIVASTNAKYEDWCNLSKAEYRAQKQRLIDTTLDALNKYVPSVKNRIDYVEAATPCTFERYTLHGGGSSFGTKFEGLEISMGLPEQVGGAFHTGSVGIIMSGWLGAANYGVIVAHNIDKYLNS